MPTREEAFPSKYLKAADLQGRSHVVTISHVQLEEMGQGADKQEKWVSYFVGKHKGLVLNGTNWDSVEEITGHLNSDDWPGSQIEIYPTKTTFRAERKDCVRVRPPTNPPGDRKGPQAPHQSGPNRGYGDAVAKQMAQGPQDWGNTEPALSAAPSRQNDLDDAVPF